MGFWFVAKKVIWESDIVVLVFDARMPELSQNPEIKALVSRAGKEFVVAFNKIDLVSEGSLKELKMRYPHAFFVSGINNLGIANLRRQLLIIKKRMKRQTVKVGIVGYPNVGKSAIINALVHRARAAISSIAGTTKGIQFIKAGGLKILDSPGVIPLEDNENKLGFIGAKNPEDLKNPDRIAFDIINMALIKNRKSMEEYAGITLQGSSYDMFLAIGKRRGILSKGGIVDERRTAIQIIRDWQRGKLKV